MQIDGYTLENSTKIDRVKEKFPDAEGSVLLAHYDKLGGLITKGGQKIKTSCFWDSRKKVPYADPQVVYLYSVNGRVVEVPEGSELPGEVRAAKILEEEDKKTRAKASKARAKKAAPEEGADEAVGEDE